MRRSWWNRLWLCVKWEITHPPVMTREQEEALLAWNASQCEVVKCPHCGRYYPQATF
jgi:hypothetical protein